MMGAAAAAAARERKYTCLRDRKYSWLCRCAPPPVKQPRSFLLGAIGDGGFDMPQYTDSVMAIRREKGIIVWWQCQRERMNLPLLLVARWPTLLPEHFSYFSPRNRRQRRQLCILRDCWLLRLLLMARWTIRGNAGSHYTWLVWRVAAVDALDVADALIRATCGLLNT